MGRISCRQSTVAYFARKGKMEGVRGGRSGAGVATTAPMATSELPSAVLTTSVVRADD